MERDLFEDYVAEALEALPELFLERIDNVEIVVEEWPDRHTLRLAGVRSRAQLLGFYHGVPLTHRTTNYNLISPDKISIYRRPIEMRCHTEEQLRAMVTRVVHHEIAHYFGISDERLHELDAY